MADDNSRIDALAARLGWNRGELTIDPAKHGATNTSYFCDYHGESYVIRLGSENQGLLSINRSAEEAALRKVSATGCGAELCYYDVETGNMVTRRIIGRELAGSDLGDEQILCGMTALLKRVHRLNTDYELDIFGDIESRLVSVRQLGIPLHRDFDVVYRKYHERAQKYDLVHSEHRGLCHGDPFCSNFILADDGRMYLIDYEYSAMCDIFYDFACVTTGWSRERRAHFLELYFGGDADIERLLLKLYDFAYFSMLWNGMWAYLKSRDVPREVFDYVDFGDKHINSLLAMG